MSPSTPSGTQPPGRRWLSCVARNRALGCGPTAAVRDEDVEEFIPVVRDLFHGGGAKAAAAPCCWRHRVARRRFGVFLVQGVQVGVSAAMRVDAVELVPQGSGWKQCEQGTQCICGTVAFSWCGPPAGAPRGTSTPRALSEPSALRPNAVCYVPHEELHMQVVACYGGAQQVAKQQPVLRKRALRRRRGHAFSTPAGDGCPGGRRRGCCTW